MQERSSEFPAELSSVGLARRFAGRALADMGASGWEYEASVVVSELASNSVMHAHTSFRVTLAVDGDGGLIVRVADGSSRAPVTKTHSATSTTGRGLALVAALAAGLGVDPEPDGKSVWCRFGPADDSGRRLDRSTYADAAADAPHHPASPGAGSGGVVVRRGAWAEAAA